MIELLAQIHGKHHSGAFTAAIVLRDDQVIEAAPIVAYMVGWDRAGVRTHCRQAGWKIRVVRQEHRP
ncbi:MAG TPA: hypothetical protein VHT00_14175 [Stellaceae bacterium]|jgi:hypothetical protein|nr:hypothetical protein [Stellaceae bacterium]